MPAAASSESTRLNEPDGQIPFVQELLRKTTHMGALVIPGGYYLLGLSKSEMLSIMIPIALVMILVDISRLRNWWLWRHVFGRPFSLMIRAHEQAGDFTGATYILISACATIGFFSKPIAIAALAFIIVGDTLAALIGRRYGRHRFLNGKSYEGTIACFAGTAAVALLAPDLAISVGLIGALVAAVVEALPLGVDDNISVPILSGVVMTLTTALLRNMA